MTQFLLELLSEEIPARMQLAAKTDLEAFFARRCLESGVSFKTIIPFVTPRRLGLCIDGLPQAAADIEEERKGPRIDAPPTAIEGFLKSTGLTLDQCKTQETPKGTFYVATIHKRGIQTHQILTNLLGEFLHSYRWPKSMTWGNTRFTWVRPLRSILAILEGEPLSFTLALGQEHPKDLKATNHTVGHRFLSPNEITITDFTQYKQSLKKAFVLVDDDERKVFIQEQLQTKALEHKVQAKITEGLLHEVTGLVEWPVVYVGEIEDKFMGLPPELLETTMRVHQRYFPTLDTTGNLAPFFMIVANHPGSDHGKTIIHGNERVLQARFSDAAFYWDIDRKQSLDSFVGKLENQIFHAQLGTLHDRVVRIEKLVQGTTFSALIPVDQAALLSRAAHLCKADLCSGMVSEFPELQGIMGKYYALNQGEKQIVAQAIQEHYAPQGPNDPCPTARVSVLLALADKVDTLVGFFGIGMTPTGSKDPFALRRAALGIIRLIRENNLSISLKELIDESIKTYHFKNGEALKDTLLIFIADRLKVYLRAEDIRHDIINAALGNAWDGDIKRLVDVASVLKEFLATPAGTTVIAAYRRAANIVRIEEKRENRTYTGEILPALFEQGEERELHQALDAVHAKSLGPNAQGAIAYAARVHEVATIKDTMDLFFDKVTVNCADQTVRENRLKLLSMLRSTLDTIADFSKLEA